MHAVRIPAPSVLLSGPDCQDSPRTVLPWLGRRHHPFSVVQAGRSLVMQYSTRGIKHALILGCSAPKHFTFRDLFDILVVFSSDCHSPSFTPAYDIPSTDQSSSTILSSYSRVVADASSIVCHNAGINLPDAWRSDCRRLL